MDDLVSQSYIYQTPLVHDSPVTRTQSSIENLVPETIAIKIKGLTCNTPQTKLLLENVHK